MSVATLPAADRILKIRSGPVLITVGVINKIDGYNRDSCWLDSNMGRGACTPKEREVLESFIMALVCAGVQDETTLSEALTTTLEALANHF